MPSRASLAPTDSDGRALVAQGYGADAFLDGPLQFAAKPQQEARLHHHEQRPDNQPGEVIDERRFAAFVIVTDELDHPRSEEHTSELQSLMRISYAVFCLKNTNNNTTITTSSI